MAGANAQRTSWVPDEVRGKLNPRWYKPIEPYIAPRVQIIAAYGTLYIATARGLYALDAETGSEKWVYPTNLPLGHSPTVHGGIVYVGGFDRKLHAINAFTGQGLWTFQAGAGFDTNPLVVDGKIFLGNRDGYFYAVYAQGSNAGQLAWKFQTQGPVHFSAAYKDGVVYFASDDSYAYALNAQTGGLVWKSAKLLGAGFHSWWPVVFGDLVIFAGSSSYRTLVPPGNGEWLSEYDRDYIFPDHLSLPKGTLVGARGADGWVDASKVTQYFEDYPAHRTYFVLNRSSGTEVTYDFDNDGRPEYAPILWFGTHAGNRYPPVVGPDGVLYQANAYSSQPWGFRGQVSGWRPGTRYISTPGLNTLANDEPVAYSAAGNVMYWNLCCDRTAGAFDFTNPNPSSSTPSREWVYFSYDLSTRIPGYNSLYHSVDIDAAFGGANGVYGEHGEQNPPIPYSGKVYMHRSNTIIAFDAKTTAPVSLALAQTRSATATSVTVDVNGLKQMLASEVQKILAAGHLRPGYLSTGNFDRVGRKDCGDNLLDYWSNPLETIYALTRALPYLSQTQQQQLRTYLQSEFANYSPASYTHIGWATGSAREVFPLPPEVESARSSFPANAWSSTLFSGWTETGGQWTPHSFYALWKYAQVFGGAKQIFDANKDKLSAPPSNATLTRMPLVHNAYIAGYWGYLELQKLAGYTEDAGKRTTLNSLLSLRAATFTKDSTYGQLTCNPSTMSSDCYCKTLNVASNFMNMVPELGQYLHDNALSKVSAAVNEYNTVAPYWFVSRFEATYGEGGIQPLFDYNAVFQAKALVLQQSASELVKYLDVPGVAVGDLFYIQNLVSIIEAASP
ncbi:MAG: PQQ-like beta-propeller repeat protein [Chloroflexi bacterium]|nr:PQQ-like beta-propeller repeat protein [Chloroflexota bacterium]